MKTGKPIISHWEGDKWMAAMKTGLRLSEDGGRGCKPRRTDNIQTLFEKDRNSRLQIQEKTISNKLLMLAQWNLFWTSEL